MYSRLNPCESSVPRVIVRVGAGCSGVHGAPGAAAADPAVVVGVVGVVDALDLDVGGDAERRPLLWHAPATASAATSPRTKIRLRAIRRPRPA
jgi:hypothetical protein